MDTSSIHSKAEPTETERELAGEVRDLERRVSTLERQAGIALPSPEAGAPSVPAKIPELPVFAEAIPILGRALLGIAGAYLLRALTEFGALPRGAGVAAGIAYAAVWLWLAARLPEERGFAIAVNSLTSAVILAPLLWEATIRFHTISAWTAAAVIAAFSWIGQALCWRKDLKILCGISTAAAALIGVVLSIATYDLAPFTLALIAIAGGVEFAAGRDRASGSRWFVAAMADFAVLLFTVLIGRKEGLPEGYAPTSPWTAVIAQALLLLVYGASAAVRTLAWRRAFSGLEAAQTALAFAIGLGGAFQIAKTGGAGGSAVAWLALFCGMAFYAVGFARFGRERARNLHVHATFAFVLVLAGSLALASGVMLVTVLAVWALGCCWGGLWANQPVLGLQGAILLLIATSVSGAGVQSAVRLANVGDASVRFSASGVVVVAALFSYWAMARISRDWAAAPLIAGNLAWVAAGMAASGLAVAWQGLAGGRASSVPTATLGTASLMLVSLGLAWGGVKWQRRELIWLVYTFMILCGVKLLMLDLHLDNTLLLVVSLLMYGGTLTVLPWILRKGKGADGAAEHRREPGNGT